MSIPIPCAYDGDEFECALAAEWRVHDIEDAGRASVLVCPNHVGWAQDWVRSFDLIAALTKFSPESAS